jgi:hypothetical protein
MSPLQPTTLSAAPTWQCVMVCWGSKYPVGLINHLMDRVARQTAQPPRFVLITDREHPELRPGVLVRQFPDYWLQPQFKTAGCHAKLAMFEKGVLPDDLPAVYIDLDTVIMGDMHEALSFMDDERTVLIFQSAIIPFGPLGRLIYRLTDGRKYARGNSSIVVFHPKHNHFIAERFKAVYAQHPDFRFPPMIADERFISWSAQPHMKRLPKSFAVKFPNEFMFPREGWLRFKAMLPWVRARREGLTAITLCGLDIKPEKLLALNDADVIQDNKARKLVWSTRVMGSAKQKIIDFYQPIVSLLS